MEVIRMKLFDPKVIGKNISKKRKALGITQTQLSNLTKGKIPATSICRYEKGTQKPSLETIYYFAQALGCSVDELIMAETGHYAITEQTVRLEEEETLSALAALIQGGALQRIEDEGMGYGDFFIAQGDSAVRDFVDEFYKILSLRETAGDSYETLKQRCIANYAQRWHNDLMEQAEEIDDSDLPY